MANTQWYNSFHFGNWIEILVKVKSINVQFTFIYRRENTVKLNAHLKQLLLIPLFTQCIHFE